MNLFEASKNQKVRIISLSENLSVQKKLLSVGVMEGDILEVVGRPFWKSPIVLKHGQKSFFALRKDYALSIQVEQI